MKTNVLSLLVLSLIPDLSFAATCIEPTTCPSLDVVQRANLDYGYRISRSPDYYKFTSHAQYFGTPYKWRVEIEIKANNYSAAYNKAKTHLKQINAVQGPNYVDGCRMPYQFVCEYTKTTGYYIELYTVKN